MKAAILACSVLSQNFGKVKRNRFRKRMGRALEDWLKAEREAFGWPAAEMREEEKHYDLPGFEAREVEVTAAPAEHHR